MEPRDAAHEEGGYGRALHAGTAPPTGARPDAASSSPRLLLDSAPPAVLLIRLIECCPMASPPSPPATSRVPHPCLRPSRGHPVAGAAPDGPGISGYALNWAGSGGAPSAPQAGGPPPPPQVS
jgi:hypothetical protein